MTRTPGKTTLGGGSGRRWWSWSSMSQVEAVGTYTRQSLYFILVATNAFLLIATVNEVDDSARVVGLVAGGVFVTAVAIWALGGVLEQWPEAWPLPQPGSALLLVAALAYAIGALAWIPGDAHLTAVVISVLAVSVTLGALPDNRIAAAIIVGSAVLSLVADPAPTSWIPGAAFAGAFVTTARLSMWLYGIVLDLDEARQAQSELAVMEERLRFSRDVHDVLGRRLSTIAVQAELAATLAQRGDERAPERMLEVRSVAHQALREARELARGYRQLDFGQELDGARSLLQSAGIDVQLQVDDLPHGWEEPAGWVVREAVTNILRHSAASTVRVTFAGGTLEVVNDGANARSGPPAAGRGADDAVAGDGTGLRSLRERLEPLGVALTAGPTDRDGWTVSAEFPGAGPLSARASVGDEA